MENGKLTIAINGLNQIYSDNKLQFTNYREVAENYISFLGSELKNCEIFELLNKFSQEFVKLNKNFKFFEYKNELEIFISEKFSDIKNLNNKFLDSLNKDLIFLDEQSFLDIIKKYDAIIFNSEPFYLFLEFIILENLKYHQHFQYNLYNVVYDNINLCPKNFIVFHHDLSFLYEIADKGAWTIYLAHYIYTSFDEKKESNPFYDLNKSNVKILKENGKFFNFSISNFIQLKNYLYLFEECNTEILNNMSNKKLLDSKIDEINPIRVLFFYKIIFKKRELKRAKFFISNKYVLFTHHLGIDDNLDLNFKFSCILFKFSQLKEKETYKILISNTIEYTDSHKEILLLNSLANLNNFLERPLMVNSIRNFCEENNDILKNVYIPLTNTITFNKINEKELLKEYLVVNNLNLPIILKFTGLKEINNKMVIIINEEGIQNFITYITEFINNKSNHEGKIFN